VSYRPPSIYELLIAWGLVMAAFILVFVVLPALLNAA
jgi:hypothetical protein